MRHGMHGLLNQPDRQCRPALPGAMLHSPRSRLRLAATLVRGAPTVGLRITDARRHPPAIPPRHRQRLGLSFVATELASDTCRVIRCKNRIGLGMRITTLQDKSTSGGGEVPSASCWRAIKLQSRRGRTRWGQAFGKPPFENRGSAAGGV